MRRVCVPSEQFACYKELSMHCVSLSKAAALVYSCLKSDSMGAALIASLHHVYSALLVFDATGKARHFKA